MPRAAPKIIGRIFGTMLQIMQESTLTPETPVYSELATFVAIAEALSFTRASQRLRRDATVISKRLSGLEARLGVRLVERTTRRVSLTEAGTEYLERARAILRAIDEADREIAAHAKGEPRGHLRLALPGVFGRMWLAPLLNDFLAQYPRVTIEAEFSNRFVDLVGERFDLAVRLGKLDDSRLVARRVASRERLLVAAPAYLAQRGAPRAPADLAKHDCLMFSGLPERNRWALIDRAGRHERVVVHGPLMCDEAEVLRDAALAGRGIFLATDWLVGPLLHEGRLVRVLARWRVVDEGAIHVVTPSGSANASKTRAFSAFMAEKLAGPPWRVR
jgi:DNA-binding transcriptional LysR family regulator